MNRHPVILDQLAPLLPPGGRRPETRLLHDLGLGIAGRQQLATAAEEAWSILLDDREIARWRTLADVADSIAGSLALEAA